MSDAKGNSFANGNSMNNGPYSPRAWLRGYQAPPPVTHWDFTEPCPAG